MLKAHGFLTRDPRVVERKKYGKAKPAQIPVLQRCLYHGSISVASVDRIARSLSKGRHGAQGVHGGEACTTVLQILARLEGRATSR